MNSSNFDPEAPITPTLYCPKATFCAFERDSHPMDIDGSASFSRKSFSASLTTGDSQHGSFRRNTINGRLNVGECYNDQQQPDQARSMGHDEIHPSRTSNFGTEGVSFCNDGPDQVPQGNLSLAYDVEAARNNVEGDIEQNMKNNGMKGSRKQPLPILLKFVDVKYKVALHKPTSWKDNMWRRNRTPSLEKEILHGISGSVSPGEFLAMMGPSGSGKTTLLGLLGGINQQRMAGSVTYNDHPFQKSLKRRMGFVTQDDILHRHLTVRETLVCAALLMVPKELNKQQKIERADQVICDLGLERCRNTRIGGPFLRGISGGERKRVCIGHELLMDPSLILLDEPTSGLDSTTAFRTVQLLKNMALEGRTVITTIHQPSSRVFHNFDKLILLSEGHLIYYGKAAAALDHFSCLGFNPHIAMNPADFLLDLCSGNTEEISLPPELQLDTVKTKDIRQHMINGYESLRRSMVEVTNPESNELRKKVKQCEDRRQWGASWWEQFSVLLIRGLKERRHEYLSWTRFTQVLAISVMAGLLWWHTNINTERALEDQVGLLFFMAMFWGYFPLFTAIFAFPQEKAILAKERRSDMYCLSAYFLALTLGDLPLDLILNAVFMVIVYLMAHLRMSVGIFLLTILASFLDVVTSQGLGLAIGAATMDLKKGTTLASVVVLAFMISGGYFVQHIPVFMSWIRYCSFQYYTFKLLMKVQYSGDQPYDCVGPGRCRSLASSPAIRGTNLGGGGSEVLALLIMIVGYRIIAYIALRRMKLAV
eukprot:PITA_01159